MDVNLIIKLSKQVESCREALRKAEQALADAVKPQAKTKAKEQPKQRARKGAFRKHMVSKDDVMAAFELATTPLGVADVCKAVGVGPSCTDRVRGHIQRLFLEDRKLSRLTRGRYQLVAGTHAAGSAAIVKAA